MKTLKINDKVQVIAGDHKGETAKIVAIDRENGKACLEGIRVIERHMKKTQFTPAGKKTIHQGIDFSNLKLVEAAKFEKKAEKTAGKTAGKAEKAKKGAK